MSFDQLYEKLNNKSDIQKDIDDIKKFTSNIFYDKYLKHIHREVKSTKEKIKREYINQLELLESLKPFVKTETRDLINKFSDFLLTAKMLKSISLEINNTREKLLSSNQNYNSDLTKKMLLILLVSNINNLNKNKL